jgi:hypothetical protein
VHGSGAAGMKDVTVYFVGGPRIYHRSAD